MKSGVLRVLSGLSLVKKVPLRRGVRLDNLGFKAEEIRIFPEHRQLVATFEIGGNEKLEFVLFLDTTTGTKIVRFVHPVKAGPAESNHRLDFVFRRSFLESKKGDEVDHEVTGPGLIGR